MLKEGFQYESEKRRRDVIMAAETMPPIPFDPKEKRFVAALRIVLSGPEYAPLTNEDYVAPWFKPREKLTRKVWADVKTAYLADGA